jgi:hypothetical protein
MILKKEKMFTMQIVTEELNWGILMKPLRTERYLTF